MGGTLFAPAVFDLLAPAGMPPAALPGAGLAVCQCINCICCAVSLRSLYMILLLVVGALFSMYAQVNRDAH